MREKCYWKHQQVSCDCNIGTSAFMSQQNTTKDQEAPKRKRHGSKLDYSHKTQKNNTDLVFVEKWKMNADACADVRNTKITPQTQTQQQQTQGSGQRQETADTAQVICVNKETANLNRVSKINCKQS